MLELIMVLCAMSVGLTTPAGLCFMVAALLAARRRR